ncbi:MAG: aldo/keto reductase [Prevotellaceae bacterium]|jgi:predicted aldo/keto reductase-like oxidoreductase|nr:aldo/keto reductase [Prevotellaceae bacterium]
MENNNKNEINRRNFLKTLGIGAIASTAALYGCDSKNKSVGGTVIDTSDVPTDKMTYRTARNSGDKVSLLGYGCMRFPLRQKAGGDGEEIDQDTVNQLIDYAIEHGVNYFDTSPRYVRGWSETATGIALSRHPRNKYFIATKMSNQSEDAVTRSREGSIAMYRNSMKELQTDYLDYYLLHSVGGGADAMQTLKERFYDNGILDFLLKEREAGRIRNLGWSFHGDVKVFDYLLSTDIKWDFVQIQLNYVDWKHASGFNTNAEYLYGELSKRNIQSVIMEPLLGGRLATLNYHAQNVLKQIRPEDSPANWAFRYAGSPENVLTVLSGMVYMEHLKENIKTYSPLQPVTEHELTTLEDVAQLMLKYPLIMCTECNYCMPCPYGLNIPAIFAHYNRCVNEGNVPKSLQDENYRRARQAFLVGYDRSVPKLRQANHCTSCGVCAPHCPQRIQIPREMERIDKFVEHLKQKTEF